MSYQRPEPSPGDQQVPAQHQQLTPGSNPYAAPPGYSMPPPVPYYPPAKKGMSVTSLVLGIVSMFFGAFILIQLAGLVFGLVGLSKEPEAKGIAITGVILNGLALLGWGIFVAFLIAVALGLESAARYGSIFLLG